MEKIDKKKNILRYLLILIMYFIPFTLVLAMVYTQGFKAEYMYKLPMVFFITIPSSLIYGIAMLISDYYTKKKQREKNNKKTIF